MKRKPHEQPIAPQVFGHNLLKCESMRKQRRINETIEIPMWEFEKYNLIAKDHYQLVTD